MYDWLRYAAAKPESNRGPSLAAYLDNTYPDLPDRHQPMLSGRPQQPMPTPMVRAPISPRAMMTDPTLALDQPSQDPNYAPTAHGFAVGALVPQQRPDMSNPPPAPQEPVHGFAPPFSDPSIADAPTAGAFGTYNQPDLLASRQAANAEHIARMQVEERRRRLAALQDSRQYHSPLLSDLASIPRRIAEASQAYAAEHGGTFIGMDPWTRPQRTRP